MVEADEDARERTDVPLKPQVVARHVNDLLADNAIVTTDSGTITTWAARHIKIRRGMKFSCSGNLATMAAGLPYANAAQIAFPDRQVVAFVGDGGFTMLGCEFITAVKHKLPIKVVVIKNNVLGQIKWEQMVFLGNPEYGVELQPIDFVKFAEACGGAGFRCERPEEVRPALEMAFRSTSRPRRSGGRPIRAAIARADVPQASAAVCRVAGQGRAQWRENRHHHLPGQGDRVLSIAINPWRTMPAVSMQLGESGVPVEETVVIGLHRADRLRQNPMEPTNGDRRRWSWSRLAAAGTPGWAIPMPTPPPRPWFETFWPKSFAAGM